MYCIFESAMVYQMNKSINQLPSSLVYTGVIDSIEKKEPPPVVSIANLDPSAETISWPL